MDKKSDKEFDSDGNEFLSNIDIENLSKPIASSSGFVTANAYLAERTSIKKSKLKDEAKALSIYSKPENIPDRHQVGPSSIDSNPEAEFVPLSEITSYGKLMGGIKVVVVRTYPKIFCGIDVSGKVVKLNQRRMEQMVTAQFGTGPVSTYPGMSKVQPSVSLPTERIFNMRVVDVSSFHVKDWSVSAIVSLHYTHAHNKPTVEEGQVVIINNLQATLFLKNQNKLLKGSTDDKIEILGKESLLNIEREVVGAALVNSTEFKPVFNEFDFIGEICEIGEKSRISGEKVNFIGHDGCTLWIDFIPSVKALNLQKVIAKGHVIAFKNLGLQDGSVFPTYKTGIYLDPDFGIFKHLYEKFKKKVK